MGAEEFKIHCATRLGLAEEMLCAHLGSVCPWGIFLLCQAHSWLSPQPWGLGGCMGWQGRMWGDKCSVVCPGFSQGAGTDGVGKGLYDFFVTSWTVRVKVGRAESSLPCGRIGKVKRKKRILRPFCSCARGPVTDEISGLYSRKLCWISQVFWPFEGFLGGLLTEWKVGLPINVFRNWWDVFAQLPLSLSVDFWQWEDAVSD